MEVEEICNPFNNILKLLKHEILSKALRSFAKALQSFTKASQSINFQLSNPFNDSKTVFHPITPSKSDNKSIFPLQTNSKKSMCRHSTISHRGALHNRRTHRELVHREQCPRYRDSSGHSCTPIRSRAIVCQFTASRHHMRPL
jgi:hypothetical protein